MRLIYRLFLEGDGNHGAMGVKAITCYLNERHIFTRDGGRWGLAQIHTILTRTTYIGEHRFNTRSHKDREKKPEAEVAVMAVPPLIDRETFDAVQASLKTRQPMVTPARVTSGPTLLTGICFCAKCGGAMTLRTGKGSTGSLYRYYTCSTQARQGKTGCKGRSIPMDKLDELVACHMEERLLQPKRLKTILAGLLDRREDRLERRREHLAELQKRITETDQRINRLFDAIESGMVDKDDAMAKERIAGGQAISLDMIGDFSRTARAGLRLEGGGYRRDHLRAFAQRVEVADDEIRIMGSKSELLRAVVPLPAWIRRRSAFAVLY
ncbi:recombinase family protein [Rhodoplanes sp. SY1]